jgi:hypothetical protein
MLYISSLLRAIKILGGSEIYGETLDNEMKIPFFPFLAS